MVHSYPKNEVRVNCTRLPPLGLLPQKSGPLLGCISLGKKSSLYFCCSCVAFIGIVVLVARLAHSSSISHHKRQRYGFDWIIMDLFWTFFGQLWFAQAKQQTLDRKSHWRILEGQCLKFTLNIHIIWSMINRFAWWNVSAKHAKVYNHKNGPQVPLYLQPWSESLLNLALCRSTEPPIPIHASGTASAILDIQSYFAI